MSSASAPAASGRCTGRSLTGRSPARPGEAPARRHLRRRLCRHPGRGRAGATRRLRGAARARGLARAARRAQRAAGGRAGARGERAGDADDPARRGRHAEARGVRPRACSSRSSRGATAAGRATATASPPSTASPGLRPLATRAATSPRTAARWPRRSTSWWRSDRSMRSSSSATPWAGSWRAARAMSVATGPTWSRTWSRSARRTRARRSSRPCPLCRRRARRHAGEPPARRLPAPPQHRHPRHAPRLAGRRGLARSAIPRRCARSPAGRCRCSTGAISTASSRPR